MHRRSHGVRTLLPLLALTMAPGCSGTALSDCFAPGTVLPTRGDVSRDPRLGQSARDLAAALLDGNLTEARRLLDGDPALARVRVGEAYDMVVVAIASCRHEAVELVLAKGAPADGARPGAPLIVALRADEPWYAERLLAAGASPNPPGDPLGPMTTAIALGSAGGVRLLLDRGADINAHERTGNTALLTALDMDQFAAAELLLARGADAWAIDTGGGNLGSAVTRPMVSTDPAQAAARDRLAARLSSIGWPAPVPTAAQVKALALEGAWPPRGASGARPVPDQVLGIMRTNAAAAAIR